MEKIGVIKTISVKKDKETGEPNGRNAFQLEDSDQWYQGFSLDGAKKGDKVKFDLEINGQWHNFRNVMVVGYADEKETTTDKETTKITSDDRTTSIVAQVLVKEASRMYCSEAAIDCSQGEYLANAVNELTGAYKLALSNIKNL